MSESINHEYLALSLTRRRRLGRFVALVDRLMDGANEREGRAPNNPVTYYLPDPAENGFLVQLRRPNVAGSDGAGRARRVVVIPQGNIEAFIPQQVPRWSPETRNCYGTELVARQGLLTIGSVAFQAAMEAFGRIPYGWDTVSWIATSYEFGGFWSIMRKLNSGLEVETSGGYIRTTAEVDEDRQTARSFIQMIERQINRAGANADSTPESGDYLVAECRPHDLLTLRKVIGAGGATIFQALLGSSAGTPEPILYTTKPDGKQVCAQDPANLTFGRERGYDVTLTDWLRQHTLRALDKTADPVVPLALRFSLPGHLLRSTPARPSLEILGRLQSGLS